jgi:Pyridoxamine 5'-phosphate oxidase
MPATGHSVQLSRAEGLRLLGSVPFGRVVFTSGALPAVRLACHVAYGEQIVIYASLGAAVSPGPDGTGPVVAYEADQVDAAGRSGWSVVVVGRAAVVKDEELAARYRESLGPSWSDGQASQVITITADLVSGYLMSPVATGQAEAGDPSELAR